MRFVSIASGSSGNCIYVGTEKANILVDAGISNKRIEQGLNEIGVKGSELSGIVITHEHSDHVRGLGVLARKPCSLQIKIFRRPVKRILRNVTPFYAGRRDLDKISQNVYGL